MDLYTVVEAWELDNEHDEICLFQPSIICDSLEFARKYVEYQITSFKERKDKSNIFFKIFKYELNKSDYILIEDINL